jgi:phospholipid/cholesterol/gamma-HCH transport system substrate-binding protein
VRDAVANLKFASERIATVSGTFDSASVSLESTLSDLRDITAGLRRGEGTLGLLLKDDRIYHDLARTLVSVDSLVQAVKEDPKKYFSFSVF